MKHISEALAEALDLPQFSQNVFKIEKGHQIPTHRGKGAPNKYPFHQMEVGDSFFACAGVAKLVIGASKRYGKTHNMEFVSRKEGDGSRIWRAA